jgi:hypothetical protein
MAKDEPVNNCKHFGSEGDDEMDTNELGDDSRIFQSTKSRPNPAVRCNSAAAQNPAPRVTSYGSNETTVVNREDNEMHNASDDEGYDSEAENIVTPLPDDLEDDENIDPEMGGENDPSFNQEAFDEVWATVLDKQADGDYSQEELDAEWLNWYEQSGGPVADSLLRRARRGHCPPLSPNAAATTSWPRADGFAEHLQDATGLQQLHEGLYTAARSIATPGARVRLNPTFAAYGSQSGMSPCLMSPPSADDNHMTE